MVDFSFAVLLGYASDAIGITVIFTALYEKVLWRFNPFEDTPKLAAHYHGILRSSYDNIERSATLNIKQTLLSVHVILLTEESKSTSLSTSIDIFFGEPRLTYCYLNVPTSKHREHSEMHFGTATLFISNPRKIEGQYYTDRKTVGDMIFTTES